MDGKAMVAEKVVSALPEKRKVGSKEATTFSAESAGSLRPNDVLIGRGTAYNEWMGNQNFRALVKERRDPYNMATKNETKSRLAREFLDFMKNTIGARFMLLEKSEEPLTDIIADGVWKEVKDEVALDKIKLAFRQRRGKQKAQVKLSPAKESFGGEKKEPSPSSSGNKKPRAQIKKSPVSNGPSHSSSGDKKPRAQIQNWRDSDKKKPPAQTGNRNGNESDANDRVARERPSVASRGPSSTFADLSGTTPSDGVASVANGQLFSHQTATASFALEAARLPSHSSPILPTTLTGASSVVDPRPLLFQHDILSLFRLQSQQRHRVLETGSISAERMAFVMRRDVMQAEIREMMQEQNLEGANAHEDIAVVQHIQNHLMDEGFQDTVNQVQASLNFDNADVSDGIPIGSDTSGSTPTTIVHSSGSEKEDTVLDALAALSLADFPRISKQEEEAEMAALTNEERVAALSDLLGQSCSLDSHQSKRPRRDLDRNSIDFLIEQMKLEIDLIPAEKKQAFLEAQRRCRCYDEEFGNARYEKFLTCQGMNTKLAAERFVTYWQCRRELFGEDKFSLRMTLSEALRDDIAALMQGQGYSPENLVRAVWYLMEIAAREHDDFVWILWQKDSSLWHHDRFVISHVPYYYRWVWPIKMMPTHCCGANAFVRRILRPVVNATLNKDGRCRTLFHDDFSESQLLALLDTYGIRREALPTVMGGTIDLDTWLNIWVSKRRALEMEEL